MPFGLLARVGPWNHVLDGGLGPPRGRGNFWGKWRPSVEHRDTLCVNCAKRMNRSKLCRFGCWLGCIHASTHSSRGQAKGHSVHWCNATWVR